MKRHEGRIGSRLVDLSGQAPAFDDREDPDVPAWAGRLRARPAEGADDLDGGEVAMAILYRAADDGPLRTFSGGLKHECGIQHSVKSGRALGWEGEAQRDLVLSLESEPTVARINTESVTIEGVAEGIPFSYTIDVEVVGTDGRLTFVEVKRTLDDLRDPRLRVVLAHVTEICRRIAIRFIVVLRGSIWINRHHRRNCELAGRARSLPLEDRHLSVLAAARGEKDLDLQSLAERLEPGRAASGLAVVMAAKLRGLVALDLAVKLRPHTPVSVRAADGRPSPGPAAPTPTPTIDLSTHWKENAPMSPPNRLPKNSVVRIRGADHGLVGRVAGRLNLVNSTTGMPYLERGPSGSPETMIDDARLADMIADGTAKVSTARDLRAKLLADAGEVTAELAVEVDGAVTRMLRQLDMLDDDNVPQGCLAIGRFMKQAWTAELEAEFGPHDPPGTLKHWRAKRGVKGRRHPRDMIRGWGRGRRGSFSSTFVTEALGASIVEAKSRGEKHKAGYTAFADFLHAVNEGRHPEHEKPDVAWKVPHPATYKNWWDEALQEETETARLGRQGTDQVWHGAGRVLQADYAMHRVIVDHTELALTAVHVMDDGEIVAVGRVWLTLAIDVKTRAVVAHLISFIPPCAWTLGEIVRRIVLRKRPPDEEAANWPILIDIRGVPVELVLDNATEFRSYSAERAFRASGIGVRWCKIKAPRYRAVCERKIGTVEDYICENVPGAVLPIAEARRISYDPTKTAVAEIDQIEGMANIAVALANIDASRGIRSRAPAAMFEADVNANGIRVLADLDDFLRDFQAWEPEIQLTRSGIEVWGLRYGGDAATVALLNDLAGLEPSGRRRRNGDATATVGFAYDPMDIGRIHVWNRRTKRYATLHCMDVEYADGMPKFVHEQIVDAAKAQDAEFASEADRIAVRNRLLQAKRTLDPQQSLDARKEAMRIMEATRLRQIAGNVVWDEKTAPQPVNAHDLMTHERAALTSFDAAMLDPRPAPAPRKRRVSTRDRRDAGGPAPVPVVREAPVRRRGARGGGR